MTCSKSKRLSAGIFYYVRDNQGTREPGRENQGIKGSNISYLQNPRTRRGFCIALKGLVI
jgi:hypothetical protein